jgi:hypothetical protein
VFKSRRRVIDKAVPVHAMKAYRGRRDVDPHILNLYPRETPTVPFEYEAGWVPRAGLDVLEKRKISCLCRDSNPGKPSPLLFAIPTTLSQLSAYLEVACLNNK